MSELVGQKFGYVSVLSFVGVVDAQSRHSCECLNCGFEFETTFYYLTHKRSGRCNHCKDCRFTSVEEGVICFRFYCFRFYWFRCSAVEIALWYGVSRQTVYNVLRRRVE